MEKRGRRAGGRERRRDLSRNQPRLANAGDNDAPAGVRQQVDRPGERLAQTRGHPLDGFRLEREDLAAALNELGLTVARHHPAPRDIRAPGRPTRRARAGSAPRPRARLPARRPPSSSRARSRAPPPRRPGRGSPTLPAPPTPPPPALP